MPGKPGWLVTPRAPTLWELEKRKGSQDGLLSPTHRDPGRGLYPPCTALSLTLCLNHGKGGREGGL